MEKKLSEVNRKKKLTSMEIQKSNVIREKLKTERYIDQLNKDGINDLLFFFIISLVVALLVYHCDGN